jgi:tetratricopeptide (TPR) repeat protein
MCRYHIALSVVMLLPFFGCRKTATPTSEISEPYTFHRDVAPILFESCAKCHHPGGPAPFSLLTYDDARARVGQIAEVTQSRFMPPWLPEDGHEPLAGARRLSDEAIAVLTKWAANPIEGDPSDSPQAPAFHSGWQLGEPDLVLESPPFELPADGPNRFRNFVLPVPAVPVPAGIGHWVRAVEIRPMTLKATHHVRLGIDANSESVRRDAADAEVGYEGMAWGEDPGGQLITWTPGMTPDAGTPGAAWQLSSDDKLVLHAHLQPTGKAETIRFWLGFHFADGPPALHPLMLRVGSRDIDIPAGESHHQVENAYELPVDVDVHFAFPHAHSLCREITLGAHKPDSEPKTLLAIRRFDENWHDTYRFATPVRLPRGTRLVTTFTYDNTAANIRNPNNPPQRVAYGSNADDEMADVYLQVTPVDPAQRAVLAEHSNQQELASKIAGYRKSLELHPDDPWSIEALASCYVAKRQPDEAVKILEAKPDLLRSSVQATVILGMAQLAKQNTGAAEQQLRSAVARDDQNAVAWLGLGQALIAKLEPASAEQAFRQAIKYAPRLAVARLDLADLLAADKRLNEAVQVCKEAVEIAPSDYKPQLKLANLLAEQEKYDESLAHFAAARELAPFVYEPKASLAIACYQRGDERTADRLLREAVAQDSHDPVPHCFLGQIARRNEQWQQARKHFERASELPTPSSWPASHRSQFLTLIYTEQLQLADKLQDEELAEQTLSAWLRIDPSNDHLRTILRQIQVGKANNKQ